MSKSGSNRFSGSLFEYRRDDALDSASKYDDQKQELELNQFGGSIGGPLSRKKTFFFGSYEGLRQTTGLSFTEAVPERRGAPAHPGRRAGRHGRRPERRRARRRWRRCSTGSPSGTVPTANPLVALGTLDTAGRPDARTRSRAASTTASATTMSSYVRYLFSAGGVDTPDRTVTPRRVLRQADAAEPVANLQRIIGGSLVNEFKVGYNKPKTSATAFGPAGYDPGGRVAVGHVHLVVD